MVSIVWEMKKICGVPCPSPNNCWEPLEFTQPNLCLAPSINPNNFENHLSMHEASVVMLCLFLFIGGFALGALFGFLPLCCDFFWARRKRRRFVKIIHFLSFLITCCRLLYDKLGLCLDGRVCLEIGHQNSEPGDSGGPLMQLTQNGTVWTQIGVSSISTLKKDKRLAILYTRVSRHCDWIEKNTDGEFPCSIIEHYGQKKCNGCEPSCDNPNPKKCTKRTCNCSCECLPGLLRNKKSGKCVKKCPYKAD
ncbi:hypothetical protein niasHT_037627 [Heterodera trifolii]|uniref:Peptidase S1 domain-containing protein n=1 Tax=Heterodera trifolii TaxID=157864 RepID=A0ABD2IYI9_9BILA